MNAPSPPSSYAVSVVDLRDYCMSLPGATYDFPFDDETCVFRVGGKMFGLAGINASPVRVNLKCDPALAQDLRDAYEGVAPGHHMNKTHWNTVTCNADVPWEKVQWMIRHSYDLIVAKLPASRRPRIG